MARKKSKRRDDDEEDDLPPDEPSSDDDGPLVRRAKPKNDAWTGMLVVSLLALLGASFLFYQDHAALSGQSVTAPSFTLPGLGAAASQPG